MRYSKILVRYGDLTLKGRNKFLFIDRVYFLIREKLADLDCKIEKTHDRIYITLLKDNQEDVVKKLGFISGIISFSLVLEAKTDLSLNDVYEKAIFLLKENITENVTFKVESKRVDKSFPLNSIELSQNIAKEILKNNSFLKVDVHKPQVTLHIELRKDKTYLYLNEIKALGGYPVGIAGKGMTMLSGGIDSPVAAFLCMKQGVEVECIHFESTPLTSIESAQKVIDICKQLANYAPHNKIRLHMVPFMELHTELMAKVPESYHITIMRRMMYRLAEGLANNNGCKIIINGESIGQVASQTLGSMQVINEVIKMPVIRPLATYDKNDIINVAKKIETYNISIKPFEDCCTIYVPKNPTTNPQLEKALAFEKLFDYETLIIETIKNTKYIDIKPNTNLELSLIGLEVRNVI